jgi:ABC-type sulfate/molybdate transport systems ATPase subunit
LSRDIKEWSGGLRTEIGEKGVNLSGGQKQRVALARAVLRRPRLVLLDDPLSAVDAETERLLCERLLFGAWRDLTRVVVTHRLEFLSHFHRILYIENGRMLGMGSLSELLQDCRAFAEFYKEHALTQGVSEALFDGEGRNQCSFVSTGSELNRSVLFISSLINERRSAGLVNQSGKDRYQTMLFGF